MGKTNIYKLIIVYLFSIIFIFNPFIINALDKHKVIRIIGDKDFPPYEYINDKGVPDGFNIDLIKSVMNNLGIDYTIELLDWRSVIDSLQNNNTDIVLGMVYSPNKAETYKFGAIHNFINYCIISRNPLKEKSIEILNDKQIIVIDKKHPESILLENEYASRIIKVCDFSNAIKLYNNGIGDYIMCSEELARYYLVKNSDKSLNGLYINNINLSPREFRFSSNNKDLLNIINKGFYSVKVSGVYDDLYNNWFGKYNMQSNIKIFYIVILLLLLLVIIAIIFLNLLRRQNINVKDKFYIEERKYQTIFNSTSFGVELYDSKGFLIDINESACKLYNIKDSKAILKKNINIFSNPILKERINKNRLNTFSDVFEFDLTDKDNYFYYINRNDKFYMDVKYTPILNKNGELVSIILDTYEVTGIYEHQKVLTAYKENLSIALEAGALSAWIYDVKKQMFFTLEGNSFAKDGLSFDEYIKNLHPEDRYLHKEIFNSLINGDNEKASLIFRYINSDGEYNHYESKMVISKKTFTGVSYITGTQKDVTNELLRSQKLEELSKTLGIVMLAAEMSVWKYVVQEDKFYSFYGELLIDDGVSFDVATIDYSPDSRKEFIKAFDRLLNGETITENIVIKYISPVNNKVLYLQEEIISHQDNSGNIIYLYGTQKDITAEIAYKKDLEYYIKMTNYAIESSDITFMIYDCESEKIIGYNDPLNNFDENNTYTLEYYTSKMHPEDYEDIQIRNNIITNKLDQSYSVNIRIKLDDSNDWSYCTISGAPFEYDENGKVKKYVGFRKDNTKFNKMSKDLEDYANRIKYILSSSKIVYWSYDLDTKVISLQFGTDKTIYLTVEEYLNRVLSSDIEDVLEQFNRMNDRTQSEFTLNRTFIDTKNNEPRNSIINGIPVKDNNNKIIGYCGLKRDITNMINIQRRLFSEKEKAEKSDKTKSELINKISYELRTSLNSIIGFLNLINSDCTDKERVEYFNLINYNADVLLSFIDDIINQEDIDNKDVISYQKYEVNYLLNEFYSSLDKFNIKKGININLNLEDIDVEIELNKIALMNVLSNLLKISDRYLQSGEIIISGSLIDSNVNIIFKIAGIFNENCEFDNDFEGSLLICKSIIDKINGSIFKSTNDDGSISLGVSIPRVINKRVNIINKPLTILVAEDNDSNYLLISAILKDHILHRAKNGEEAVDAVKNKKFDIIIMDIEMPVMNGLDATKAIRDQGIITPIIALTANAYASDKKNALKAGCNVFLSKPIRKNDLLNILSTNSSIWI